MTVRSEGADWRPGASRQAIDSRARLLAAIRGFFAERGVLEVETPILARAGNSDPNIRSLATDSPRKRYLRSSPEYAMKRLLASGLRDIYELGRVFRAGEKGQYHNPEFTMLEWYRSGRRYDANGSRSQRVEELALRILEMPAVKEAVAKGLQKWKESDMAKKPGALRYAQSAADEIATLASLYCAMGTVPEPSFVWVYAAPRKWHGYYLPGSRWYADNVDTQYRGLRVDENASYVVTLQVGDRLAPQLSFMI